MSSTTRAERAAKVQSTAGLIAADALGVTLPHERLMVGGWDHTKTNYANSLFMELSKATAVGLRSIVDIQSIGLPRDPQFSLDLGARSGLSTIVSTGFWQDAWLPDAIHQASIDDLSSMLVGDIVDGIAHSGIRAGLIGDIAVSRVITATERKTLAAAGVAQQETGAAISLRLEIGSAGDEYAAALDLLQGAGADLAHVAVFGLVPRPDALELFRQIAGRGCYLGFDQFGQDHRPLMRDLIDTPRDVQSSSIKGLLHHGLGEQILLSHSVDQLELLTVNGGEGYSHIWRSVIPEIQSYRVTDDDIRALVSANPQRWLAMS